MFFSTYRNGFVSAIAMSYNFHLPLILSPTDLWLVILQGFRTHLTLNKDKEYIKLAFQDMESIQESVAKHMQFEDKELGDNLAECDDATFERVLFKHLDEANKQIWNSRHANSEFSLNSTMGVASSLCQIDYLSEMFQYQRSSEYDLKMGVKAAREKQAEEAEED